MSHVHTSFTAGILFVALIITQTADLHAAPTQPATSKKTAASNPIRLCLPPVIYAVVGDEANVYFDNVMLVINPRNYAVDVNCPLGLQQVERWTCRPTAEQVGEHPFELTVFDQQNRIVATAKSKLKVVPADAGADGEISLLVIGDSLTHASDSTGHLLKLFAHKGNPKFSLVGSFHPVDPSGKNRHEGYGGWTAALFATRYMGESKRGGGRGGSPFLYAGANGKPELNFTNYYKEQSDGRPADFVMILLGCNDTFWTNDSGIEQTVDTMLKHYDALLAAIRKASPDTLIGIMLTVPPAATQDAFGENYTCGQTRWQYKRNQHRAVERLLEKYSNREIENIFIVPTEVNLDCRNCFPTQTVSCNAQVETKCVWLSNGVHPAASGYRQIGDSMYAWLKARLVDKK
ncbi:MAG: hypothetical protein JXM70_29780 [Pirellulales bacterium]|nr:hypothetical protein [Pirellulales bacterium]